MSSDDPVALRDLLHVLSWHDDPAVVVGWKRRYEQRTRERLAEVLAHDARVADLYGELPPGLQRRIQLEPVVLAALARLELDIDAALAALVHASRVLTTTDNAAPEAIVTAGVDPLWVVFDASIELPARGADDPPLRAVAPGGIPAARRALGAGLDVVVEISGAAAAFVPWFIDLMCVREEARTPCYSGSFETLPGLAYVSNLAVASPYKLADVLVHESIHGALYVYEALHRPLLRARSRARLTSPWTGSPLRPAAYVQACIIWHALANFWVRAVERGADDRCQTLLARALRGFDELPVTGPHRAVLEEHASVEAFDCLVEVERRTRAARWPQAAR